MILVYLCKELNQMDNGSTERAAERPGVLAGDNVEVRTRYQAGQWAHGYEVAEVLAGGYRIFRRGSQEVIPEVFGSADVRLDGDK